MREITKKQKDKDGIQIENLTWFSPPEGTDNIGRRRYRRKEVSCTRVCPRKERTKSDKDRMLHQGVELPRDELVWNS